MSTRQRAHQDLAAVSTTEIVEAVEKQIRLRQATKRAWRRTMTAAKTSSRQKDGDCCGNKHKEKS